MSQIQDRVKEIIQVRGRRKYDPARVELFFRLLQLDILFGKCKGIDPELQKYFPVALVALMESYFRLTVKQIVDHGDPFLSNAAKLFPEKVNFEVLKELQHKRISLGELVAHTLPLNNLNQINSCIIKLLDKDFLTELRSIHNRLEHEIEGKPKEPILKEPDTTFAQVTRIFELRHIICHEATTNI